LGSRALDLLIALVERAGEVVEKEELINYVWPNTFVDEANLRVHVAALRRALGDGQGDTRYIVCSAGRGYSFVAPIQRMEESSSAPEPPSDRPSPAKNLPILLTRIIGRDDALRAVADQLRREGLVTIVGPGGIGKTTVTLAVTERLSDRYEDGLCFVDLGPLADGELIASALSSSLGLPIISGDPIASLTAFLAEQRKLIVLDTCEHLVESVAKLVESLLRGCPGINILATSREPLRAEGEQVYRLPGLDRPPPMSVITAQEAMAFSSVKLFSERAASSLDTFELNDANSGIVSEICSRLDGVPLAIEIAAAQVALFGVRGLADRLTSVFLTTHGRRTALPRHQTLRAMLDWSYQLLSPVEQRTLRRLAVLSGNFTLRETIAIAAENQTESRNVIASLADLVAKSLVSADVSGPVAQYRLLDTTRAYALAKLDESGERTATTRRHAIHFRRLFEQAESESQTRPAAEWLSEYGAQVDNLRAALEWAFSPDGDSGLGIALTIASATFWMHLSLIEECRRHVARALAIVGREGGAEPRQEMKLNAALGSSMHHQRGSKTDLAAIWSRALTIAEELNDVEYQLRALWGLYAGRFMGGDLSAALDIIGRYQGVAERSPDPVDALVGHRMLAVTLHALGDQSGARQHLEHMLRHYAPPTHRAHILRYQYDQRVSAKTTLSIVQWLQGFPDQAMRTVRISIDEALSANHILSLCTALANAACLLSIMTGDLVAADRYVGMLFEYTRKYGIAVWHAWAQCYHGMLLIKRGDTESGLRELGDALAGNSGYRYGAFRSQFAETLGRAGDAGTALEEIDETLDRAERSEERWWVPEMLRVKGELALMQGASAETAEAVFLRSIDLARRQAALCWELRATTSLARLRAGLGQVEEARALLGNVYGRFTEGFGTSDLMAAKSLLHQIARQRG
jgi:predicted ATPase/DNA-binding winged helix-turn-helix (wHTH) protein